MTVVALQVVVMRVAAGRAADAAAKKAEVAVLLVGEMVAEAKAQENLAREVAGTSKTTPCGAVAIEDAKISCLEMAPASVQEFVAHVFCRPPLAEVDTHWSMVHSTYPLCKIGVGRSCRKHSSAECHSGSPSRAGTWGLPPN